MCGVSSFLRARAFKAQGKHKVWVDSSVSRWETITVQYQQKEFKMKVLSKKSVGALVALGLIVGMGSAVADTTTTPKPTASQKAEKKAAADLFKAAQSAYKSSLTEFKSAMATYQAGAKAANATYKAAFDSAKATRDAAVAAATTAEAKSAAKSAFTSAVAAAKATKDSAIAALGGKPVAPVKPTK